MLSYTLSGLILLTQVGIPLNMHYCKGMLESVSVFFAPKCDDHGSPAASDSCCKKEATDCTKAENPCCSDEVTVISQQASYLHPSVAKCSEMIAPTVTIAIPVAEPFESLASPHTIVQCSDTGPPLYILHHSLIIYA